MVRAVARVLCGARPRCTGGRTDRRNHDFAPLPVLGVPGWCDANAEAAFYDDPAVFRSVRRSRAASGGAQC
nr:MULTISPECIES: DUF3025 domain-containing protein [Burkholderia]